MTASNGTASALTITSGTEITMSRVFDASRELVFKAHTDPELLAQWWGPRKYSTIVDKMDVRPGGVWRFINRGADGDFAFSGVYREVVPPERIVQTFEFEMLPGHISVETNVFEEIEGGRTRVSSHVKFESIEDRNGMVSSGMETGWIESNDRLAELLATLRA